MPPHKRRAAIFTWFAILAVAAGTTFEEWSSCRESRGNGKKALVTGVTGMLGSHIAEALLLRGYLVYGVVRPRSNQRNVASFAQSPNVTLVSADLTDPWRTLEIFRQIQPDYVFHFAAQAINSLSFTEPALTLSTNIMSTLNILESVRNSGRERDIRIFVAGSSTVYGSAIEDWEGPLPEIAQMKPVSPYGVSKVATEALVLQYVRAHKLQAVVGRLFIHLGERGIEALALHEFSKQIALIERGLQEPVLRHGDLSTQRDITDIADSAAVIACLAEYAPSGTVVNIGSNSSYSMRDILESAVEMSAASAIIKLEEDIAKKRPYDERAVLADISSLRRLTGWIPQTDIRGLIFRVLDYWRREISFRFPFNYTDTDECGSR